MNIKIIKGDITKSECECIVNAANKSLLGGGGVDGAIHRAAGSELLQECLSLGGCKAGEAKITKGYKLKAKWIIHTVGPIYHGEENDEIMLASCYKNSLNLARQYNIHSISFPSISTGAYRYPVYEAVKIAITAVNDWAENNTDYDIKVEFCCFDEETYCEYCNFYNSFLASYEEKIKTFIDFIEKNNVCIKDSMEMHLADIPYEKIKSGEKTVEIRLYDEKRKLLKVGDRIIFYKGEARDSGFSAKVTGLYRFESFEELFKSPLFDKTCMGDVSPIEAAHGNVSLLYA